MDIIERSCLSITSGILRVKIHYNYLFWILLILSLLSSITLTFCVTSTSPVPFGWHSTWCQSHYNTSLTPTPSPWGWEQGKGNELPCKLKRKGGRGTWSWKTGNPLNKPEKTWTRTAAFFFNMTDNIQILNHIHGFKISAQRRRQILPVKLTPMSFRGNC